MTAIEYPASQLLSAPQARRQLQRYAHDVEHDGFASYPEYLYLTDEEFTVPLAIHSLIVHSGRQHAHLPMASLKVSRPRQRLSATANWSVDYPSLLLISRQRGRFQLSDSRELRFFGAAATAIAHENTREHGEGHYPIGFFDPGVSGGDPADRPQRYDTDHAATENQLEGDRAVVEPKLLDAFGRVARQVIQHLLDATA